MANVTINENHEVNINLTSEGYCETGTSFFPFLLCFAAAAAPSCTGNTLMFDYKNHLIVLTKQVVLFQL